MKNVTQELLASKQEEKRLTSSMSGRAGGWPGAFLGRALVARRGLVAYVPVGIAVVLLFCGIVHLHTDALHYQCYAVAFWRGTSHLAHMPVRNQCSFFDQFGIYASSAGPFHILPLEYPPLTLSLFSLAYLGPSAMYQTTFGLLMAVAVFLVYWLLLRYGPRGAALACAFYLVVGAWSTAEGRFDLVPAGCTLICLMAIERKRWTLAYVMLAFGFLFKIYPLLLVPALFLAEQRDAGFLPIPAEALTLNRLPGELGRALREIGHWRWKNLLLFGILIVGVTGLFALINFQAAVTSQLSYFANRPVQLEATGSTALWLTTLTGHPAAIVHDFGSFNIVSNLGHRVALISEFFFVLGYALVLYWQWRGKFDLVQTFIALLLVFIVTGKVFSPQYLIWLIPLLVYHGYYNRRWLVLWGCISLMTTAIYPYMYKYVDTTRMGTPLTPAALDFVVLVSVRNLLLILVTLAFLYDWWHLRSYRVAARNRKSRYA